MTTLKWDHTVHYVNDLNEPIKAFDENGLIAFMGGSHKQWGTYNALSYFGLSYIEFLGIEDRELVVKTDESNVVVKDSMRLLPEKEAFCRVAIRTDDIEEIAASLTAQGLKINPIIDGKRLNAQGKLIEWRMMTIPGDFQGLEYPFIIQWKGSDSERFAEMTESRIIQAHPAGGVVLESGVFHVSDPEAVARHWKELFGLSLNSENEKTATLQIGEQSFIFKQGDENQLKKLTFKIDSQELMGKTIFIGEGEYFFS